MNKLALVTVLVRDYDEAISFSVGTLGFRLVEDTHLDAGKLWVVVALPGDGRTGLLLARAATEAQRGRVGDQTGGRVFLFLHTDDFARDHARMTAAGIRFAEPPRREPYGMVAAFLGLYGNRWDLVEPRRQPGGPAPSARSEAGRKIAPTHVGSPDMQLRDGRLVLSPSDLTAHVECPHLTALSVEVARGLRARPRLADEYADLIAVRGTEHEQRYLAALRADGREVVEIDLGEPRDWERAAADTRAAMAGGAEAVYQAALVEDGWRGLADFLERVDRPSRLGAWGYEVVDTKLARSEKPTYVLQLCSYSNAVAALQGVPPARMHVVLGSGERRSLRVDDFAAYWRRLRERFVRAVEAGEAPEPYPCSHCSLCDFRQVCHERWERADHLCRVAGSRRDQVRRLEAAGIATMAGLAAAPAETPVARMQPSTFLGLREQAALQLASDPPRRIEVRELPVEDGRGFALLPRRSPGDVILDFEGDPFWAPDRGLEFLTGLLLPEEGYRALWAHEPAAERRAIEELVDLIHARLAEWPDLHVYHYASYELMAIKRAVSEHATRELELDELLRRRVFVDLYQVLRQAMRVGVRSYSLKQVEALAGFERRAEVGQGSEAVLDYERWRATGAQAFLDGIEAYNREDCEATLALLDWLAARHPPEAPWLEPVAHRELKVEAQERLSRHAELRAALLEGAEAGSPRWLAGELLEYHRREARPGWWAFFMRLGLTPSELVDDAEAIGELTPDPASDPVDLKWGSRAHTLGFPEQQHKLAPGDMPVDPATGDGAGEILELDDDTGRIVLKRTKKLADVVLPRALVPAGPYATRVQQDALARLGRSLLAGDGRYGALEAMLARAAPRLRGHPRGEPIQTTDPERIALLAERLDESYLFVQGPPGSGKTYTGARLVVHLIDRGLRVGVAATSHKAIHNLLDEVERAARDPDVPFRGLKKSSGTDESRYEGALVTSEDGNAAFEALPDDVRLVAGTSWLFAREGLDQRFDVLVIDEAGQVSLADALAMGTAARSVVLLGDPLQLAQVSQGIHPTGTGASILEHLLGDDATVPPERGVFLEHTRRMHPSVCRFVSEVVYAGRLDAIPDCARQGTSFGTGIRFLPVEHDGNRSYAPEEVERIGHEVRALLGGAYTDAAGRTRPLAPADVMIVAPYNEQVRRLRQRLPDGVRVGTVDKFQGQEAPVVFYSMTSSSAEDVPRNLDFLFSRNRLNVAISRARCLAVVVASPRLLEAPCRTIEQMRLVNTLCRVWEYAEAGAR